MCYNAVDRHVENGLGDQVGIIWDSAYLNLVQKFTYRQIQEKVSKLAAIYQKKFHIKQGDRVLIYMPMTPEAVFSMLACSRIGAIHSVVFGGFAPNELANRI